jgi:hypothetical protein
MQNLKAFVAYFEDIFENCPFHSLDDTHTIFTGNGGMTGVALEKYPVPPCGHASFGVESD